MSTTTLSSRSTGFSASFDWGIEIEILFRTLFLTMRLLPFAVVFDDTLLHAKRTHKA